MCRRIKITQDLVLDIIWGIILLTLFTVVLLTCLGNPHWFNSHHQYHDYRQLAPVNYERTTRL